jgi:hypothetical protein
MKVVKLESMPDLNALVKALEDGGEAEPIALERGGGQVAVIVSSADYANFLALEETLGDQLDREESEEILEDPKWIDWEQARKQLKS